MDQDRLGTALLAAVVLVALGVDPVAAAADTTTDDLIWGLNNWLLYLAVPIAVLVEGILIYTVWTYRKRDEPEPTVENRRLEIVWTLATAVVLVAVGIGSYQVLASPWVSGPAPAEADTEVAETDVAEEDVYEVQVVGQRYAWTFVYPNETVAEFTGTDTAVESSNTLVLPTDRPVALNVTSQDWLHSFHVPEMGLKQDAFPGQYNTIRTVPVSTGTHQLYCAEYCGSGHANMLGTVDVRTQAGFEAWLANQSN